MNLNLKSSLSELIRKVTGSNNEQMKIAGITRDLSLMANMMISSFVSFVF